MTRLYWPCTIGALATLSLALQTQPLAAVTLFGPGDTAIGIDTDVVPDSSYPGAEVPGNAVDQATAPTTKYLNFGGPRTGFIVTPTAGASIVQSLQLRSGNDAPNRDPMTYELYGTNDPITSADNSFGDQESWSLVSSGASGIETDPGRDALGTIQDFGGNSTSYTSYKIVFPTLRDFPNTNSMQVDDVALFTAPGGGGTQILAAGDPALAIDDFGSQSRYPSGEAPSFGLDGDSGTKYLNFGKEDTGLIVARADGKSTIVTGLTFTTGGDAPERDPLTWDLFGTNDPISSSANSLGDQESWSLVDSGITGFDTDPGRNATAAPVAVNNGSAYSGYRLVFTSLRDAANANSMQVADILFDGVVIPEPTTVSLMLLGCLTLIGRCKR